MYNIPNTKVFKEAEKKNLTSSVSCRQCGGQMLKTKKADKNMGLQILGLFVFLIGIALLFVFPFGTIMGIILMVVAARLGYKKIPIWKCEKCGYFFELEE